MKDTSTKPSPGRCCMLWKSWSAIILHPLYAEHSLSKDFDFGEGILINLSKGCTFPWLLANAVHADGRLMVTAQEYKKWYRIGFLGLAGTFIERAQKNVWLICLSIVAVTGHQTVSTFPWIPPSLILCLWRSGFPSHSVPHCGYRHRDYSHASRGGRSSRDIDLT